MQKQGLVNHRATVFMERALGIATVPPFARRRASSAATAVVSAAVASALETVKDPKKKVENDLLTVFVIVYLINKLFFNKE